MPISWERYGVEENPFAGPVLDCVQRPTDLQRFGELHLDAVSQEKLSMYLKAATRNKINAFVVITGPNGSGRTALARYVAAQYASTKSGKKFALAEHDPKQNVSTPQVMLDVLTRLVGAIRRLGPDFVNGPAKTLAEELKTTFGGSFEIEKQSALETFSKTLELANGAFGCILDNVSTRDMLTATHTIFETSNCVVICTVTEQQRDAVASSFLKGYAETVMELRLQPLPAEKVFYLANHRWEKCGAVQPVPFDRHDLEQNFSNPQRTVGRALFLLGGIFNIKLATYPEGDPWPIDELRFTAKQIEKSIQVIEELENK